MGGFAVTLVCFALGIVVSGLGWPGLIALAAGALGLLALPACMGVAAATLAAAALFNPVRGGCSGPWTGASTGPATTQTRWWPRSRPG